MAGYIVEKRLAKMKVVVLILLTTIIGGLIYCLFNLYGPLNRSIASPVMMTWGLASCALTLVLKEFKTTILLEKISAILFILSLLSIQYFDDGFFIGQLGAIIFGLIYGLVLGKPKTALNKDSGL